MPTLWIIDIESHEQRYTRQWRDHLPSQLERAAVERGHTDWVIRVISGEVGEQVPTAGAFLNFAATNIYKSSQIITLARAFERGDVTAGDKILITDAWNPGIIQIRYMSDLLKIPVEIHGLWHAGSYDPWDFLGRDIPDKRWSRAFEAALFHAIDVNHFATQFHIDLFKINVGVTDDSRICRTGWPMEYLLDILGSLETSQKEKIVLFPHRLAPEKQIDIFRDLTHHIPDYRFIVCQDQALSKAEYHNLLAKSVMVFSANLQETLGISLYEGVICGAMPLAPHRLSYVEMYEPYWLYPSTWTDTPANYQKHKTKLINRIQGALDKFWSNRKLVNETVRSQAISLGQNFFSGIEMYNRLFPLK